MFTLLILFLILRAMNPWRWYRPWGMWGMWRRPRGMFFGGPFCGPRPPMGGFGPGLRGFGRW